MDNANEKSIEENNKIAVFKGKNIRKIIHNDEWWFSVIDVIEILTGNTNVKVNENSRTKAGENSRVKSQKNYLNLEPSFPKFLVLKL